MGLLAGLLSTGAALLTLEVVVVITADLAWRLPRACLPKRPDNSRAFWHAMPRVACCGSCVPIMAGVGWGALYAVWAEPRLAGPDAARGLVFALLPLLVDAGLLTPVLGQVADVTRVAPVALVTEFLRQACFGLILGLAYPVLRARNRPDPGIEPVLSNRSGPCEADVLAVQPG
jgi:hypothetical protein